MKKLVRLTFSSLSRKLRGDFGALRAMFGGRFAKKGSFRRAATSPITLTCAAAFLLAIGVTWLATANTAERAARARLLAASADMHKMVNECADSLLFYQGLAIVRHYQAPEKVTDAAIHQLMNRYGLDELSVVNGEGIVLSATLAETGFNTYSNPQVAKFNCLLKGAQTYSQPFRAPVENPDGEKLKYAGVAFPSPAKGYVQLGFRESRLKDGINFWFEDAAMNSHIGEQGYFIVADNETGEIKSCGRRGFRIGKDAKDVRLTLAEVGFDASRVPHASDEFFEMTLFGEKCLCLADVCCFHRVVCAVPFGEITGGGRRAILASVAALLAVFLLVVFFMTKLTDLVTSLQEKERVEHERQLKDLTLAKTIQLSSLPVIFPDEPDYKIFARMDTAREVGGDFYDFYELPTGEVAFLIADVSGKGVPAALFMMRAKATLRAAIVEHLGDIATAVAEANDFLAEKNEAGMFVTAWIGIYNRKTRMVTYVNAGHNPPLVKRANGSVEWLRARGGLVLATLGGIRYRTETVALAPGDSIFLYTDGVTEAMDVQNRQYGEARLEKTLAANRDGRFVSFIRADVSDFVGPAEPSDDITMLAFDVKRVAPREN